MNVGIDLSFVYERDLSIKFGDLSDYSGDTKKIILGIAYGSDNDEEVRIMIDSEAWEMLDETQRLALLFHELSHDILNAFHVEENGHLMHPTNEAKDVLEVIDGTLEVFAAYKNGTLDKFEDHE